MLKRCIFLLLVEEMYGSSNLRSILVSSGSEASADTSSISSSPRSSIRDESEVMWIPGREPVFESLPKMGEIDRICSERLRWLAEARALCKKIDELAAGMSERKEAIRYQLNARRCLEKISDSRFFSSHKHLLHAIDLVDTIQSNLEDVQALLIDNCFRSFNYPS